MPLTHTRFIEKFGKVVTIDQDHPLSIAQDAIDAKKDKKKDKDEKKKGGEE